MREPLTMSGKQVVLAGDDPPDLFAFIAAKNNFEAGSWNEAFAIV
jgi:hypothetical protein